MSQACIRAILKKRETMHAFMHYTAPAMAALAAWVSPSPSPCGFFGYSTLIATPALSTPATTASDAPTGTSTTPASASNILTPMKSSTIATEGCRNRADATAWLTTA